MSAQNTFVTEIQARSHYKQKRTTYMIKKQVSPIEGMQNSGTPRWIKWFLGFGVCLCITSGIILAGILPALLISLTQSTSDTTISTAIAGSGNTSTTASSTVANTGSGTVSQANSVTTTQSGSTASTSISPSGFTASGAVTSSSNQWYGYEQITLTCSLSLTNFTAIVIVQKTYQATYNNMYSTFPAGSMNQSYIENSTQIIYTWTIVSGQTIPASSSAYVFEAQFKLNGTYQNTTFDTFEITATTVTGITSTTSGHF